MHRYGALATDLVGVALTPFVALLIRDNFTLYAPHWEAILGYAAISFVVLSAALVISGSHRVLWQYTSLPDVLKMTAMLTVALVLAVSVSFFESRLEGVARSVPVIQWFLLVGAVVGTRIAFRVWHERARRDQWVRTKTPTQHVLIVGVGPLTELYLESAVRYGSKMVAVVGILSDQTEFSGRLMRQQKIVGKVEELPRIIDQLEVHGISVERVVVMEPFEQLSPRGAQMLLELERASDVKVDWIVERLGFSQERVRDNEGDSSDRSLIESDDSLASDAVELEIPALGKYGYVKRTLDIFCASFFGVLLAPLMLVLALLVRLDVGAPVVFWQQRPGRFGRPFKLFKFCTMRPAHDMRGNRISDEERVSLLGGLLRRTRLDELPQLYNVLIGEMSFVGPRPLLAVDQPEDAHCRLSVRPGLTGLAQVHGGRIISAQEKNALDLCYIRNASVWLDIKIVLRTVAVLIRGDHINHAILSVARDGLVPLDHEAAAGPTSVALRSKRAWNERDSEVLRPAA